MMFIARKIICLFNLYMKISFNDQIWEIIQRVCFLQLPVIVSRMLFPYIRSNAKKKTQRNAMFAVVQISRVNIYFQDSTLSSVFCLRLLCNLDVTTSSLYREVPVMIGSYIPHGASVSTHLISPVQSLENTSPLLSYRAQENVTLSTLSGEERDSSTSPTVYRLETGAE